MGVENMDMKTFKQNEVIFREGVYESCMYSIASGSVGIYLNYGEADEKQITALSAGQFFGEMGLFECRVRSATAVALEDAQLAEITMDNIGEAFRTQPQALLGIMRALSGRIREVTNDYMEACRAIAEAADAARKGAEKSSALKNRLAKFVRDFIKPNFGVANMRYDIDSFMSGAQGGAQIRKRFSRGDIIFRQGDASDCMYDIMWGRVGIYINYGQTGEKLLTDLKEEQFFGEMGLLDAAPRSATAVVLDNNTELRVVSEADFASFLEEKPAKVISIIQHLSSRLRDLTKDYMDACKAVSDAMDHEEKNQDSKGGWLRESMNRFINDYSEAMQFTAEHPELTAYTGQFPNYH